MYQKPWIIAARDLAEGVYAASGADVSADSSTTGTGSGTVTATVKDRQTNDWSTSVTTIFTLSLGGELGNHVTVTLNFDTPVANAWGANGNQTIDGSSIILDLWSPASSFDLTVVTNNAQPEFLSGTVKEA